MRSLLKPILNLFLVSICISTNCEAARIEADPNKEYVLSKNRGPWMIMVATFHSSSDDGSTTEGKSPQQAASELVLELRNLGMPAYSYSYDPSKETVTVTDRLGREESRKNLRRIRSICVLAGNYTDINDKNAQASLEWIKKTNPKCLREGVTYTPTPGRPGPLSGAFLTPNPMLSAEEIEQHTQDPLLVRLNNGERFSLYENKGEYTLVVARFYGKSVAAAADTKSVKDFFTDQDLDNAGEAARELVAVLRGNFDKETGFNNVEAYVWHDHHESIVTVGSFASLNDPELARLQTMFGPKMKTVNGTQTFQAEHYGIKGFGKNGDESRLWLFEPNLLTMRVPKMR